MNIEVNKIIGIAAERNQQNSHFGMKDGYWENSYEDGSIRWKGYYKNNKRTGLWVSYYEDRQFFWKGSYVANMQIGYWVWHFKVNELMQETIFIR